MGFGECVSVKYKPQRDIPLAVRELKSLSPTEIVEWIKNHRTKRDNKTGKRIQELRKAHSISMFFQRNPDVYKELKSEIEAEEVNEAQVKEQDFLNGNFQKIPCVQKWIMQLRGRGAKEHAIKYFLTSIRQICLGQLPRRKSERKGKTYEIIEDWGIKHPRALSLEDCLRYNSELVKRKLLGRNHRLAMRNFLKSRMVEGWDTISGKLEKQKGQYAHLYVNPEKKNQIFAWLKPFSYEAYLASKFSFKCGGARLTATLEADAQYVNQEDKTIVLFEKANRNAPKRKVTKEIPDDFYKELEPRIKKGGKLFHIEGGELSKILRACYKEVIPDLEPNIPMPFHFWRHQFAQHMLRKTKWNYAIVANLGGWKVQTLEDYYGAMDRGEVRQLAREKMMEL